MELGQWAGRNHNLSAKATNELRNLVHKTILENLEVGPTPVHLGPEFNTTRFRAEPHIGIFGNRHAAEPRRSDDRRRTRRDECGSSSRIDPDGPLDARRLSPGGELPAPLGRQNRSLDRAGGGGTHRAAITDLQSQLSKDSSSRPRCSVRRPALERRATTSTRCSAPPRARFLTPPRRGPRWTALVAQAASLTPRLRASVAVEFGESRGTGTRGGVRAIQVDRLLPIVEAFTAEWRFNSDNAAIAPLMRAVAPAVDEEWDLLGRGSARPRHTSTANARGRTRRTRHSRSCAGHTTPDGCETPPLSMRSQPCRQSTRSAFFARSSMRSTLWRRSRGPPTARSARQPHPE